MKKIFSYILIFVFLFAISTAVTIKIGQADQTGGKSSQTTTSAGANESLLNGLMSSFDKNPKQNVDGSINVTINGEPITLILNANLNLKTITNPDVQGSLKVCYGTDTINAAITYANKTLYFSANNMQLMVKIDDISDLVSFIKELTSENSEVEQPEQTEVVEGEEEQEAETSVFDINALMAAIENPKKTIVDNQMFFDINLQGICSVNMVTDLAYNLQQVKISDFAMLDGVDINGELSLVSDSNIQITAPDTENYLDVGAVAADIEQLIKEDYLTATIWGAAYKDGELAEYVDAIAAADLINNKYSVSASLKGIVNGTVGFALIDNWAYVNYNDLYLKTDIASVKDVAQAISNNMPKVDISGEMTQKVSELIEWLKQNYKQLLQEAVIASNQVLINVDMTGILGQQGEVTFQLGIMQGQISSIKLIGVAIGDYTVNLSVYLSRPSTLNIAADEDLYFNLQPILQVVGTDKAISTIVSLAESKQFSGILSLTYGEVYATGEYVIDIADGVKAQAKLNICGVDVFVAYQDGVIYADVLGLKVSLATSEINDIVDWLNTILVKFNKQPIELNSSANLTDKLGDFKLTDIKDLTANGSSLSADVFGANVSLSIDNFIEVNATSDSLQASLTLAAGGQLSEIDASEYQSYTKLAEVVDTVLDLIDQRQFKIDATATVYEGSDVHYWATCVGEIDIANFALYLNICVTDYTKDDLTPMNFMIAYKDAMWYVDYNNLKISINKDDLAEIAVILLKAIGMDVPPALEGILGDAIKNTNVDVGNIATILPNMDTANPIAMLKYLKSLSLVNGNLSLVVDSSLINSDVAGKDMVVTLSTAGGKVKALTLKDIYTGVTEKEHFNLTLTLGTFSKVSDPDEGKYIDLSGSNELIKAIINTAELNYFNITGSLDIKVLGFDLNVPLDIKVKLDDNRLPEVIISLPKIPVIGASKNSGFSAINVNNDNPYKIGDGAVDSRHASIYYKDGYVYIYRYDKVQVSKRVYEKKLKVHISQVLDDPLYYLQYVIGFSDEIIGAIQKSLDLSKGHTPDLGNIINYFNVADSKTDFEIQLNMYELTNDPNMGNMTIGLGVINNQDTNGKNYVGKGSLNLTMPFTNTITMVLNSNDLALVNIGKVLDFSDLYNFIDSYKYDENEEWVATNNSWSKASELSYTISFEPNPNNKFDVYTGQQPKAITGIVNSDITLPTLANYDNIVAGGKDVYKFIGWYTDAKCKDGNEFATTTMPRGDRTLYAKWQLIEEWRTVTYVDYFGNTLSTQYAQVGESLNGVAERTITTYSQSGDQKYIMTFAGWINEAGDNVESVEATETLQAIYNIDSTYNRYNIYINTGVAEQDKTIAGYKDHNVQDLLPGYMIGEELVKYDKTTGTTTYYTFGGWYTDASFNTEFDGIVPNNDSTVYANWQFEKEIKQRQIIIYDNGKQVYKDLYVKGDAISLPAEVMVNADTLWYTDANYKTLAQFDGTMPDNDLVLHIRNKYVAKVNYYALTGSSYELTTLTQYIYQGEQITLPEQKDNILEFGSGNSYYRMVYTFGGYTVGGDKLDSTIMPNTDIEITNSINSQKQYKITFNTTWVKPSTWNDNNNTFTGKIVCESPASTVADLYVNEGETIDPSVYTATAKYAYTAVWATAHYNFEVVTWNTSGCNCITDGATNKSYTKLTSLTVNSSQTLYATWGKA